MIRVSVRFNLFGVRVIKQDIVPCKLLVAASEIAVFVGCNITDATPKFCQAHTVVVRRMVNSIGPRSRKRLYNCEIISLPHKPQRLRYLPLCYSSAFLEL